jgi:hypothetical protein
MSKEKKTKVTKTPDAVNIQIPKKNKKKYFRVIEPRGRYQLLVGYLMAVVKKKVQCRYSVSYPWYHNIRVYVHVHARFSSFFPDPYRQTVC